MHNNKTLSLNVLVADEIVVTAKLSKKLKLLDTGMTLYDSTRRL